MANTRQTYFDVWPISSARTLECKSVKGRMMGGADVHSPTLALSGTHDADNGLLCRGDIL